MNFKLYLITDRKLFADNNSLFAAVELALKGGVRSVQLREKDMATRDLLGMAYRMRELTARYNAKLFINDRVDIALCVDADGVHIGQSSIPVYAVRKAVHASRIAHHAPRFLIGVSTHNLDEAMTAQKEGADFITYGPLYQTPSKLQYGDPLGVESLRKIRDEVSMPVLGIGGIKPDNAREVMNCGADGIAVISGILCAADIKRTVEEYIGEI